MKREPICTVYPDQTKVWRLDGEFHRKDGPAVVYHYGTKLWYINGKLHRIDGPAVMWSDDNNTWWLNHEGYTFNVWCKKMKLLPEEIIEMKLLYG